MTIVSIRSSGCTNIYYKEGKYYYENGKPVPQLELDKFPSTVFRHPPNQKNNIHDESWFDEIKETVKLRRAKGLLKKPQSANH